jgi:hypothetical protein
MELYQKQTNTGPYSCATKRTKLFNAEKMVIEWNNTITKKLQESINHELILTEYSYKTIRNIHAFRKHIEEQVEADNLINPHIEEFKAVFKSIQSPTTETILKEDLIYPKYPQLVQRDQSIQIDIVENVTQNNINFIQPIVQPIVKII